MLLGSELMRASSAQKTSSAHLIPESAQWEAPFERARKRADTKKDKNGHHLFRSPTLRRFPTVLLQNHRKRNHFPRFWAQKNPQYNSEEVGTLPGA